MVLDLQREKCRSDLPRNRTIYAEVNVCEIRQLLLGEVATSPQSSCCIKVFWTFLRSLHFRMPVKQKQQYLGQ